MSCLRGAKHVLSKATVFEGFQLAGPQLQFARGIKPRWLPKSASKIFYVRKPTPITDPELHAEVRTMYFHYRAHVRALRKYLLEENVKKSGQVKKQLVADNLDITADFQAMEQQIEEWNSRIQAVREEGVAAEKKRFELRMQKNAKRIEEQRQERLQKAETRVARTLEDSKSFITIDNLETEIEKLLNLRKDYNFAIDKQGNKVFNSIEEKTEQVTGDTSDLADPQKSVKT